MTPVIPMPKVAQTRLVMLIFLIQSIAMGSWFPRIPDIQQALGLGPSKLAIALLGMPVGTLVSLSIAGGIAARIGARQVIIYGFVLFLLAAPLPGLAWNIASLFIALMMIGVTVSALELGMNVAADAVERDAGRKIMSTCHGFWSLGQMIGSVIGVGFAALGVPVLWALVIVSVAILPVGILAGSALASPFRHESKPDEAILPKRRAFRPPSLALIGLSVFVLGVAMAEGAAADWSAVFLREVIGVAGATAGLGYTAYAIAIAFGRFAGDNLSERFGPVALARSSVLLAIAGILTLVTSSTFAQSIVGLIALGFGCSVGFPLGVSAAASFTDRPAASNVAVMSLFGLFGFLIGPPMIGFVAGQSNLRYGLAMLLIGLGLSLVLAGRLRPKPAASRPLGPMPL